MYQRQDKEYSKIIHSRKWRKLRLEKIKDTPLCEMCSKEGKVTIATLVHHIVPLHNASGAAKERLAYEWGNLMSLCDECHERIHSFKKENTKKSVDDFFSRF